MADETKKEKTVWVECDQCGNKHRNHRVLYEHKEQFSDGDDGWDHDEIHQLIQCMGCETVRYRRYSAGQDDPYSPYPNHYAVAGFPNGATETGSRSRQSFNDEVDAYDKPLVPETVDKMYRETIKCFNAGAKTLTGGGLRATVEAICKDLGMAGELNLVKKIDGLVTQSHLTAKQAELLHEERYLGNAALHELETPTREEIEDGLQIIETLIRTIYILGAKADRLRSKREKKAKAIKKKAAKKKSP